MKELDLRPQAVLVYSFSKHDRELKDGWCIPTSAIFGGPSWNLNESIRLELSKHQAYGEVKPDNDDEPYVIFRFVYQNPAVSFHKWLMKEWSKNNG